MKLYSINKKVQSKSILSSFFFPLSFFFFLYLSSCKEKTVIIPDSVLAQDTIAAILVDMQLAEAMKIKAGITDSLAKDSLLVQYALIFKKHHISQEQFEQSFAFYKANPKLLEEIYDKTINELSRMQAMLGNINTAVADSIKKSRDASPPHKLAKDALIMKAEKEKTNAKKKSATGEKKGTGKEEKSKIQDQKKKK